LTAPSFAIVCTTIGDGSFLKHYTAAITGADARGRVTMIVIPDRKTPAGLYAAVEEASSAGIRVDCPDLSEQAAFLAKLGAPEGMFPWDTDHRRNIGYLMAWRDGADIMVSVDDDNLPQDRWLLQHAVPLTGMTAGMNTVSSPDGYWNPGSIVHSDEMTFWPRGFPYGARDLGGRAWTWSRPRTPATVAINAGLWRGDPDVDAITRIALRPVANGLIRDEVVLAAGTWAPVNSQNTAVRREVIPAYYFFRSGRFGDIYQGYLAQAAAKAMGHSVRFGTPAVTHARNDHDLLHDLELELPDIRRLDDWLDWLTAARPEAATYADAYASLASQMAEWGWRRHLLRESYHWAHMAQQMQVWLKLIRTLGAE
jgi:hypothetical protein